MSLPVPCVCQQVPQAATAGRVHAAAGLYAGQQQHQHQKTGEVAGYASVGVTILGGYMGVRVRPPNVFLVGVRTVRASVNHVAVWH